MHVQVGMNTLRSRVHVWHKGLHTLQKFLELQYKSIVSDLFQKQTSKQVSSVYTADTDTCLIQIDFTDL